MPRVPFAFWAAMALAGLAALSNPPAARAQSPYTWKAGPPADPNWFMLGVWYQSYSTTLEQLDSQRNTIAMSSKLVHLVLQRFQVNQATILDVKAAQASHETTGYQLVNLNYAAKVAEIELKRLMYQLGN